MMFQRLREWWWKRRGYVRVDSRAHIDPSLYPLWSSNPPPNAKPFSPKEFQRIMDKAWESLKDKKP